MNTGTLIKDIIEKIKLWLKNFFNKKKQNIKKKQAPLKEKDKQKKVYLNKLAFDNGNKSANIGTIYPKLSKKNLELLNKKTMMIKNKIIDLENSNNNIKIINNIIDEINQNDIYINQAIKINHLLNEINEDKDLNLNTNEKLNILKDNISLIIDKKLDDYENDIIKKAYNEYNQVNYVIMTSLMIDDIINEINELTNDFEKNKYSKAEYERRINKIKDKIDKLEIINNRKEVRNEIEDLRKDFYTKQKDKYDLLYNEEIFINLNNRCDELLDCVNKKEEQEQKRHFIKEQINYQQEKKKEEKRKQKEQQEKEKIKEKELNDNILKRFIDLEFAHKLLLLRESTRKQLINKQDIIRETLNYYNEFLIGETHHFNFERNRIKTEVAKLYNDITSTICMMEKKEFVPLEHINIKLEVLAQHTLERQEILNYMVEKKHNYKIEEHETNKSVANKLTNIINNEKTKEKEKENGKVLKKEQKTQNNTKQK